MDSCAVCGDPVCVRRFFVTPHAGTCCSSSFAARSFHVQNAQPCTACGWCESPLASLLFVPGLTRVWAVIETGTVRTSFLLFSGCARTTSLGQRWRFVAFPVPLASPLLMYPIDNQGRHLILLICACVHVSTFLRRVSTDRLGFVSRGKEHGRLPPPCRCFQR